ncbi:MAG: cytochrome c biogenesis protein CcdA [Candidatus Cyclobacteriaceae bacterium M3_2C_046]
MKRFFILFFLIIIFGSSMGQIIEPATWSYDVSQEDVTAGDQLDLIFKVNIDSDWYLYSSDFDPDLGPMVTTFVFEPNDTYELVGDVEPIGAKEKYDEIFEGDYTYFKNTAEFRQTVKVLKENPVIQGSYEYQVCSEINGQCIPFDDEFTFDFSGQAVVSQPDQESASSSAQSEAEEKIQIQEFNFDQEKDGTEEITEQEQVAADNEGLLNRDPNDPYSLMAFMLIAFLGGLAALLTPCVFPMIPMTVTFFTGKSSNHKDATRKALFYGFSIIGIYIIAGTVVAMFNGPEFANWLSTHWIPNVIFFLIFFIFALSFLGLFEITLPTSFVNKVDKNADKGGLLGVFFMAFTLVLVSFSCTGPIVGSILVESFGGQIIKPVLGMFAFSLAFAIPFTLFAIFPEWLSNLPKSGGWLNSVKVVLGFLELALGLKFLSVADQVYHWGLLDRDVYLTLWIVIFALMGFYLLGKIRLPHDSKMEYIGVPRLILAIITFSFVVYLIPGLFGAPLKILAGYLPPTTTQDFNLYQTSGNFYMAQSSPQQETICEKPKYSDMLHFPHGIQGYFDYEQALECARELNKPLFIDFTGHGCVNCREMEARVWSDPDVLEILKNDYVVVALYVDEKTKLPEADWYESEYDGKLKKTMGKQNADFQIVRFNNNAQPYYVLLDNQEELLMKPKAYDLNVQNFVDFLETGLERFQQREGQDALARK